MSYRKTFRLTGGWRLVLDSTDDATPAMVYGPGDISATYWCAIGTGCLTGDVGDFELPASVLKWLNSLSYAVDALEDH